MDLYQSQNSVHQIIASIVAQVSKIDRAPQMRVAVRIAAGTLEWTFPSDLDG